MISYQQAFLALAEPAVRQRVEQILSSAPSWAELQQAFLAVIDEYVEQEMAKPLAANIHQHEAGGQWRIAFPHLAVRGNVRLAAALEATMAARKAWTDAHFYHGYHDCHEVHHQIETFIYFQVPLFYWGLPGAGVALASIEDVAHHTGNWVDEVPAWYDWDNHQFCSAWLGTRQIRAFPPYDYQEANHFRFIDVAMAAYLGTGNARYLRLVQDYADRWCEHIEAAAQDEPIRCAIFPPGVTAGELGRAGQVDKPQYKAFYSAVSDNTAYDVAGALLDLYRVNGEARYLQAAEQLMDQFLAHGRDGRPAQSFSGGEWHVVPTDADLRQVQSFITDCTYLARLALRHDIITGTDRYRQPILAWAAAIDEERYAHDQMMANTLIAAHYYTGDPAWLIRAYAMALRTYAVVEGEDAYHQCGWNCTRQGTKFLMEMLYQPMLGGGEWGTRGNILLCRLRHTAADGSPGLPPDVALRTWRIDSKTDGFEAVNTGTRPSEWRLQSAVPEVRLS